MNKLMVLTSCCLTSSSVLANANANLIVFGKGQKYEVTQADIACIKLMNDKLNGDTFMITFTSNGSEKFAKLTAANLRKPLDKTICGVQEAPMVMAIISSKDITQTTTASQKKCLEASKLVRCP